MTNHHLNPDPRIAAHQRRVCELSRHLGNENTPGEEQAAACLASSKPAYWTTASVYHAVLTGLLPYLNEGNGVEAAFGSYARDYQKPEFETTPKLLDRLIPLNEEAVRDLGDAYLVCGTFRDPLELARRDPLRALNLARAA